MTYNERNQVLMSEQFAGKVRIALCDWINYWAINGTESIEDADLRAKTDLFLGTAMSNIEAVVRKASVLIIAEAVVKEAVEVTDANVTAALTNVMSHAIDRML